MRRQPSVDQGRPQPLLELPAPRLIRLVPGAVGREKIDRLETVTELRRRTEMEERGAKAGELLHCGPLGLVELPTLSSSTGVCQSSRGAGRALRRREGGFFHAGPRVTDGKDEITT